MTGLVAIKITLAILGVWFLYLLAPILIPLAVGLVGLAASGIIAAIMCVLILKVSIEEYEKKRKKR